jgi:hypothetical protein
MGQAVSVPLPWTKNLAGAVVAIDVVDVSTGQRLAAHQPDLALIPASTQKLITTAVAMDVLGAQTIPFGPACWPAAPSKRGCFRATSSLRVVVTPLWEVRTRKGC